MKKYLMTAAALALLTTTASASELITFYKGTYWQTWVVAANESGNKMCGMHIEGKNFRFYVKWDVLAGMALQVWKSNWKFAANSVVPFEVKFHDNAKPDDDWSIAIEAGEVRSNSSSVFMAIRTEDQSSLLNAFAEADAGMISFPAGNEQPWILRMEGSRRASQEFMRCIYVLQQEAKATQPTSPAARRADQQPTSPAGPHKKDQSRVWGDGSL